MVTHSEFLQETMRELLRLLEEAPKCNDIIVQCRNVIGSYYQLGLEGDYQPFLVLVGLESDTDHLPKGSVRKYWNEEALNKKDQESKEIEQNYREDFLASCEGILSMLKGL